MVQGIVLLECFFFFIVAIFYQSAILIYNRVNLLRFLLIYKFI